MANEIVLIAANEHVAQWLWVRLYAHAEGLGDFACPVAEVGFGQSLHPENLQGNDGQEHVNIDVGNHGPWIDSGVSGEVFRSEQALFFPRNKNKQNGAAQFLRMSLQGRGHVEQQGTAGAVVHGTVVDTIAVDGLSDGEVVNVSREGDVF